MKPVPLVWSIAGTDSGGGAGLAADQRAADAFAVHLCPVVAAVTAQNSQTVTHITPMSVEVLEQQLQALAHDMPPLVIKTGLLGGVAQIQLVARWIDKLRQTAPVALVVDPVLASTTGTGFADAAALAAYRDELLPRATLITPNRREACALLGLATFAAADETLSLPELARGLRLLGPAAVCITGGDSADQAGLTLDWLNSEHACGWLASPRIHSPHHHGTGCTFATSAAAALALGFVTADAVVLAKMATTHALQHAHAAGSGAGPVKAQSGFATHAALLPWLSWSELPLFTVTAPPHSRRLGLYALVEDAARVRQVLDAGVRTVQLRIKTPLQADALWHSGLREEIASSIASCRAVGAELFINDHWQLAHELGANGVHLGQEDLLALGDVGRATLAAADMKLGVSSHSLWELCRARSLAPRYIACGPVWPTLTKLMPWQAQGLHNLRWWQHMAGAPVVAIGGILTPEQVQEAASCGVDGVCLVRGLGVDPQLTVPVLQRALAMGAAESDLGRLPLLPHPTLIPVYG